MPVALISGGASGIGACCGRRFLSAGWRVVTLDLLPIDSENSSTFHLQGDVTSEEIRRLAVERTVQDFGGIHALVHSAGVGLYQTSARTEPEHLDRILQTNLVARWRLSQLALPHLRRSSGAIISMGSVAGDVALPWSAAYSASKAALQSMMDAMRRELAGEQVRVIDIRAGIVRTDFRKHVLDGKPPSKVSRLSRTISPEEVAGAVVRAAESGKSGAVYVPRIGRLFALAGAITPGLMDRYLASLHE